MKPKISRWTSLTSIALLSVAIYFTWVGILVTESLWLGVMPLLFSGLALVFAFKFDHMSSTVILLPMLLLVAAMAWVLHQHLAILYLIICLLAIEQLEKSQALIWVILCLICIVAGELFQAGGDTRIQDAAMNGLLTILISGLAFLKRDAELSREKSDTLLKELEDKNQQLALYSAEREQRSRRDERQRISRDLHDSLGHSLTTSLVQLDAAEKYLDKDPSRIVSILANVRQLLSEGLDETRSIVRLLDQPSELSLDEELSALVTQLSTHANLRVTLSLSGDEQLLPQSLKTHIFRIIQEGLTNIYRHADATEASIEVCISRAIRISICDNGRRLDSNQAEKLPTLHSIESRTRELKGELKFVREEAMTKLNINIPLIAADEDHEH
jgi:signal transduction histidine kinase